MYCALPPSMAPRTSFGGCACRCGPEAISVSSVVSVVPFTIQGRLVRQRASQVSRIALSKRELGDPVDEFPLCIRIRLARRELGRAELGGEPELEILVLACE